MEYTNNREIPEDSTNIRTCGHTDELWALLYDQFPSRQLFGDHKMIVDDKDRVLMVGPDPDQIERSKKLSSPGEDFETQQKNFARAAKWSDFVISTCLNLLVAVGHGDIKHLNEYLDQLAYCMAKILQIDKETLEQYVAPGTVSAARQGIRRLKHSETMN